MRKRRRTPSGGFHALCDKMWREDFLREAWERVRRNGGTAGVDGESFKDIEARGVEGWLGELGRDLREGTYRPKAVRQVLIPKKQPGKLRPLGIPCIRDRVAQSSAMLVLEPIFEADLQPEQYGYRPGRSAKEAAGRVHGLLQRGHEGGGRWRSVQLLRRDSACGVDQEHCPAGERREDAEADQGMAGDAGGGGRRGGWQAPPEPGAEAEEGGRRKEPRSHHC